MIGQRLRGWLESGSGRGAAGMATALVAGVFAVDAVAGLTGGITAAWGWLAVAIGWGLTYLGLNAWARLAGGGGAPGAGERLQALLLFVLCWLSFRAYFSPDLVGPKDARWYGNLVMDFLTRVRAGDFPVFSGESVYAFNGNILTVRSAPGHPYMVGLLDVLTARQLSPLAVQHLALWLCYVGGVGLLQVSLVRLRPSFGWSACAFASIYAMSPALITPLVLHDMYMTFTAMPLLVFVWHSVARVMEQGRLRHYGWVGLGCAGMWYAHPPLGFLGTIGAWFLVSMQGFSEGVSRRWLQGCALGAAIFGGLVWPLIYAQSEIPPTNHFFPLTNLIMPALGLFLLGYAVVGFICGRRLYPLAVLPTAGMIVWEFKPSLVPFALVTVAWLAVAALADGFAGGRLGVRRRPEPWLLTGAIAGAVAATLYWPGRSLPARELTAAVVGESIGSWGEFFRLIIRGADTQPHAAWWLLLAAGLVLHWRAPSRFGRGSFLVALAAVCTILPVPVLKQFIWSNTTVEFWDLMVDGVWLRFWPFALPVALYAAFILLADLAVKPWARRALLAGVGLLLPWAAWDHVAAVRSIHVWPAEQSARFYRPENIILQSYSWHHLMKPAFYSPRVMDPRMEIRLWRQGGDRQLLLDPDAIARGVERAGSERIALTANQDPTYPAWVYLAPRIAIPAGTRKLLRFDFKGREPQGWLIVRGQDIYQEYTLPSAGFARSFGAGPLNTRTLSIENTGGRDELIELVFKREGPGQNDPVDPAGVPTVTVSTYSADASPIHVKALSPLHFRIDAPEAGMLEVFRNAYPGYRVYVNGQTVPYIYSRNGLVAFAVPAGVSDVMVRFRGTWQLRDAFWYGVVVWTLAGVYLLGIGLAACGWRGPWRFLTR